MKSFIQLSEEKTKKLVMFFGRMNPPTKGHEEHINKMMKLAAHEGSDHLVIASHSQDAKRNPLSPDVKLKHLKRAFPQTNIITSSKEKPTILHHAQDAYNSGVTHLTVVAGDDRAEHFSKLLKHFNGRVDESVGAKGFKFKSIKVIPTGNRKSGVSGTDMRTHAHKNDFKSFSDNLPTALRMNPRHAKELFKDVRKCMGLHESKDHGLFKAIFVTGGPGSGKDIIVREAIAEQNAVELNTKQVYDLLQDKHRISQKSTDIRSESIRNRMPLIINGPADDLMRIAFVKEELEELGYDTLMVFVDTTNETSQQRNEKLAKSISEDVRLDKWNKAQITKQSYIENFEYFVLFDNSDSLSEIEESISDTYSVVNMFLDYKICNENALDWLQHNGKLVVEEPAKAIQRKTILKYNPSFGKAKGPTDVTPDNRAGANPLGQDDQIKGDTFPRKDPNGKGHSGGAWSGAYSTEESQPTITVKGSPKESNFQMDSNKKRLIKKGDSSFSLGRSRPSGIGQEYDTRAGGQSAAAGAGLGNQTYSEDYTGPTASNDDVTNFAGATGVSVNPLDSKYQPVKFDRFRKKLKKEAIDDPGAVDMGVGGTLGGATNKEGMDSYKDPNRNIGIQIKKKKKQEN